MEKEKFEKVSLVDSHAHLEELDRLKRLEPFIIIAVQTTANASELFQIPFNSH
jgi:hypothetical protein